MGSCIHIFHCTYIELYRISSSYPFLFLTYLVLIEWKNMLLVTFIKFSKFVTDDSIAQEIQDSNNFSGIFQPRIEQLYDKFSE